MSKSDAVKKGLQRRSLVAVANPMPTRMARLWRKSAHAATIGIFVILSIGALDVGRPVLLPVTSAFVVMLMLGPFSARAERFGVPTLVTAIVLWVLVAALFYGVLTSLAAPVVEWIGKASEIGSNIQAKLHVLDRPLRTLQSLRAALLPVNAKGSLGVDIVNFVQPVVAVVVPGIGQMLIFFGVLFFMLLGRSQLRRMLVAFFNSRDAKLRALKTINDIERSLTGYLGIISAINIGIGICSGLIAWGTGLPYPIAWAVLGFILNYIAYIGALVMEASMFLVGLVAFPTLTHAIIPPLLYLCIATLEGHFITPSLVGYRLTLNPLMVFLSLVFWAWLWGPVGAFLAAPLLIVGLVVIHHLSPPEKPELPA